MGQIKWARTACARGAKMWNHLPASVQEDIAQCPCQGGIQDPEHILKTCTMSEHIRQAVLVKVRGVVAAQGTEQDKDQLESMTEAQVIASTLSSVAKFSGRVEKGTKSGAAKEWSEGLAALSLALRGVNRDVAAETTARVTGH